MKQCLRLVLPAILTFCIASATATAQVGKSVGVVDANTAPEKALLGMPHMTPGIVKGILE
jgi:hypothetical protein